MRSDGRPSATEFWVLIALAGGGKLVVDKVRTKRDRVNTNTFHFRLTRKNGRALRLVTETRFKKLAATNLIVPVAQDAKTITYGINPDYV